MWGVAPLANPRMAFVPWLILAVVLLALVYIGISWYVVDRVTKPPRRPLTDNPALRGLAYENVTFHPRGVPSLKLNGWYIPASDPKGTIVAVHCFACNRAEAKVGILGIARRLVAKDFNLLLFDLRGHGSSDDGRISGGLVEREDVLGAVEFVHSEYGTPLKRIGLLGFSLGAVASLLAAAEQPEIAGVVTDSAFYDMSELMHDNPELTDGLSPALVKAFYPGMRLIGQLVYDIDLGTARPIEAVSKLPFPLLIVHGGDDQRVPTAHAKQLYSASVHRESELWIVPDAGHGESYLRQPSEYIDRVVNYFEKRFQGMLDT